VNREAFEDFETMRNGQVPGEVGRQLSEVEPERVDWLWRGRIPKGKLTLIDGDPGLGKTVMTIDCAARVSVGCQWPDGAPCVEGGVVICSAEDGLADTIRPRLDAAGGDPEKVLALGTLMEDGNERLISIPEDISAIEQGIERVDAAAVFIDPLMAFLSGRHNAHKDQDVRRALAPLAGLAERTGVAVAVVRHLNKATGGNPLYRGGGSIGIVGAARSALLVAKHPEEQPCPASALIGVLADRGRQRRCASEVDRGDALHGRCPAFGSARSRRTLGAGRSQRFSARRPKGRSSVVERRQEGGRRSWHFRDNAQKGQMGARCSLG
jgi:hypothetical protein